MDNIEKDFKRVGFSLHGITTGRNRVRLEELVGDRERWKDITAASMAGRAYRITQKKTSYFKHDIRTRYNSDPEHRCKLRVIQVNRLTQVLTHREQGQQIRTATPSNVSS
jgi:hypothetical protein